NDLHREAAEWPERTRERHRHSEGSRGLKSKESVVRKRTAGLPQERRHQPAKYCPRGESHRLEREICNGHVHLHQRLLPIIVRGTSYSCCRRRNGNAQSRPPESIHLASQ